MLQKQILTESNFSTDVELIHVLHGRVIYSDDDENGRLLRDLSAPEDIMPFVKPVKFREQQEYRFDLIQGLEDNRKQDIFHLKVSDRTQGAVRGCVRERYLIFIR